MSSTEVAVSFPMPACTYTIRRGSATGAEIRFATVGEPVFHVWSCPSGKSQPYIILDSFETLYCDRILWGPGPKLFCRRRPRQQDINHWPKWVLSFQNLSYILYLRLFFSDSCGVDRYIIQTPNYNEQLNIAYQESHVFKFADKMITRFTCQIKICVKAGNGCQGITVLLFVAFWYSLI